MRLIAALILAVVMYVAVPMLWQRAMVAKVKEISANQSNFPVSNESVIANVDTANLVAAINPPPLDFNVEEAEAFGAQAAADRQMRDISAAQDAAARAQYP